MILDAILKEKKSDIEKLKVRLSRFFLDDLETSVQLIKNGFRESIGFYEFVKKKSPIIIAECKKASPSLGIIRSNYDPVHIAKEYERLGASAISVLTDLKFFEGRISDLQKVSKAVSIPVLRKDFILSKEQILEAKLYGAKAVLLIVRILSPELFKELFAFASLLDMDCLVEVHNEKEIEFALQYPVKIIGINHRDLDALQMNMELSLQYAPEIKKNRPEILIIAESGIENKEMIQRLRDIVDGFLIGTYFMKSASISQAWNQLFNYQKLNI